jgi:hypothetical protein
MKTSHKLALVALVLGLTQGPVLSQNSNRTPPKQKPASEQPADSSKTGKRPGSDSRPDQGRGNQPERPEPAAKPVRPDPADELKKIREEFKQAQSQFVEEQNELRQKLKQATADDRARIRSEIQAKRQSFVDQQREVKMRYAGL